MDTSKRKLPRETYPHPKGWGIMPHEKLATFFIIVFDDASGVYYCLHLKKDAIHPHPKGWGILACFYKHR